MVIMDGSNNGSGNINVYNRGSNIDGHDDDSASMVEEVVGGSGYM